MYTIKKILIYGSLFGNQVNVLVLAMDYSRFNLLNMQISLANWSIHSYSIGCDLDCLKDIKRGKEITNSFDEFYKRSEAETKSLVSKSASFIATLKQKIPQLYKDLLSTFFPVDPKVVENLEILMNHFGIETVKAYPSLFLATAFIRRKMGVNKSEPAVCGGTYLYYFTNIFIALFQFNKYLFLSFW